jgi:hypothetical protein
MTEAQWLTAKDPDVLLDYLEEQPVPPSERKARLFAVACCRRVWDLLSEDCREAVEVIERYADGDASALDLASVRATALSAGGRGPAGQAAWAVHWAANRRVVQVLRNICDGIIGAASKAAVHAAEVKSAHAWNVASAAVAREQAELLRDCFGNPFRPVSVEAGWLAWGGGVVRHLAQAIYTEEAFDRLPVLADALEEAGCSDADILGHCRQPGEHVRGCWVVDLVLAKR